MSREEKAARIRAYRASTRELRAERDRAYQAANRERISERERAYRLANRESRRALRANSRERARQNNEWIDALKLERGCEWVLPDGSVCGYREYAVALDFDHRDPTEKAFQISRARLSPSVSRAAVEAEIAKCDVLCANHHRVRTVADGHTQFRRVGKPPVDDPQLALFEVA
jgi:hypothetical protein